ncbi:MAG: hypothetical protein EOP49_19865 [Sphingobacteriales bacterium]|nr:MAG: hypothetical protein EOP49_19865 [Sphingobacteriales bacterium]
MKNFVLTLACISFLVIVGAAIYEHLTMVPKWSAAPPLSLAMFQGKFGLNSGLFWMPVHPVTLVLMITALALNWKTPRRLPILGVLSVYIVVLLITSVYFVPELLAIINTPFSSMVDAGLQTRASRWEIWSIVRLFVLLPAGFILLSSLTKPANKAL